MTRQLYGGQHAIWTHDFRGETKDMEDVIGGVLVIRDCGDWNHVPTITNDIEYVVFTVYQSGALKNDMKFYYHDSRGIKTEVYHSFGRFRGFGPEDRDE
jgi:hypothetical protein